MQNFILHNRDCLELLSEFNPECVDAVVTDPPYEISFMGRSWDSQGVSFQKETWEKVLRVLKPGGYLLAFGSTRTYPRIACAIEDAGFELKDTICWITGQGFPKNLDVSRAIDKKLGAKREVLGVTDSRSKYDGKNRTSKAINTNWRKAEGRTDTMDVATKTVTKPVTSEAQQWAGFGTALKPAIELICVARKPLSEKTIVENVLKYGTGAINIDRCRVESEPELAKNWDRKQSDKAKNNVVGKMGLKNIDLKDRVPTGRWPANLILSHHSDCKKVGTKTEKGYSINRWTDGAKPFGNGAGHPYEGEKQPDQEVEVWGCVEDGSCPIKMLDEQSGIIQSGIRKIGKTGSKRGIGYNGKDDYAGPELKGSVGGASRFFKQIELDECCRFAYVAKANKKERGKNNDHPTVKPIKLLQYLVRLVGCQPGSVILDPFMGSGTTGIAAIAEGFRFIGVEKDVRSYQIAKDRLEGDK